MRVGGSKEEREVSEKIQREIKEAAKAAGREELDKYFHREVKEA